MKITATFFRAFAFTAAAAALLAAGAVPTYSATKAGLTQAQGSSNGNTISGSYFEDTPQWSWKSGYGPHNVTTSMYKNAVFNPTYNRRY